MGSQYIKKPAYLIILAALLLALLNGATVQAAAPPSQSEGQDGLTLTATAGYDGLYKPDHWVPIRLTLANNGPPIEGGIVRIITGSAAAGTEIIFDTPIDLPTQSEKELTTYIHLTSATAMHDISLLDSRERELLTVEGIALRRISADSLLYGIISPEPDEFSFLSTITGGYTDAEVSFIGLEALPPNPAAWHALDVLVLNDVDSGELSSEQQAALRLWIEGGGQLVVTGGVGWQQTTTALSDLLPVIVSGTRSTDNLQALSDFAALPFRDPGPYILTESSLRSGELVIHQDGQPILARVPQGRGSVYFLALDPRLAPLVDWDGSELVWSEIADATPRLPYWAYGPRNSYSAVSAAEALPALALPSVLQLVAFLLIYIIVIGPTNYFILRRMGKREWAWVTIPAIVLFFTGSAYLTGFQLKGNRVIVNEMSVAYGSVGAEEIRYHTILGLYSPRRSSYDITFPSDTLVRPIDRSFGGLGGGGNIGSVLRGDDVTITDMQVDVSGVQALVAQSYGPAPGVAGTVNMEINGSSVSLDISIQNNSERTLDNANLIIGSTSYPVRNLESGDRYDDTIRLTGVAATEIFTFTGSTSIPGSGSSPLQPYYIALLGTSNYYSDPDVQGRYQTLESLSVQFGGGASWYPTNVVTLVFWTDYLPLPYEVGRNDNETVGDTLYFLELPIRQNFSQSRNSAVTDSIVAH